MNGVTEFISSFIPDNLPKKRKEALKSELLCHILDKSDYYRELGFGEEESILKAKEDFGEDEDMKNYIYGEFEELYNEKTRWGILAGIFIQVMNWMCIPLDIWVVSADTNRDPDPAGAFVSFCMIFLIVGLIIFARIKKYRKMLICIGVSNLLVVGILLWCFYPQMAGFSMLYNAIYLIDRFTPLLLGKSLIAEGILYILCFVSIPVVLSLYPFTAALLLKKGKISDVKNPRKKCIITGSVLMGVCIASCMLQPAGWDYYEDYPVWLNPYVLCICEETNGFYDEIAIGDTMENTEKILREEGFRSLEDYRTYLDRLTKKQFDANMEEFTFIPGYTVYFHPEKHLKGEGLIGVKYEKGKVTGVAVGNIGKYMYDEKNSTFGYYNSYTWESWDSMEAADYVLSSLKAGDGESITDALEIVGGEIYAKRKYTLNGEMVSCYRIYFYGEVNPDAEHDYQKNGSIYAELTFSAGRLISAEKYSRTHQGTEYITTREVLV